ncbi:MAG: alpha-hydroxy acid oxidase [Chloroflexota bacterium]|nr:alpha-hydroxy acid oxidase [Chloroflexota bacterium]
MDVKLTVSQLYARGKENLQKMGVDWAFAPDGIMGAAVQANRRYLDSLFFEPKFLDPVEVDTGCTLFGARLKTPIYGSPISRTKGMPENSLAEIARGLKNAGSLMMLGMGGSPDLQSAIDTGVPVVKIVKPYRTTELIYEKVRDAEQRGCVAVGMDIDHFYGRLGGDKVERTDTFAPQSSAELKQVISGTKLPFIIKGVLSLTDAAKAVELGAAAVLVSNHGRNAFDFTVPSMIALPGIVDSVGGKVTVLVDTGFKTGNDVFKGLAFGARGVGFGGSLLLAWGADGAAGVESLVNQLTAELHRTMAAAGCPTVSAVKRSCIVQVHV